MKTGNTFSPCFVNGGNKIQISKLFIMKKIVLAFSFIFILMQSAFSQSEFRFGFQVSPSFSWMATDDPSVSGDGSTTGLRLGMVGEYYFADNYAVTSGIGFAFNQGGALRHDMGGNFLDESDFTNPALTGSEATLPDGVKIKYGIQYVEIPLGLKMRTQDFGYLRYYAELPIFTLGFKTQANGVVTGDGLDGEQEGNIKSDVNLLNLSWGLGGGAEYTINENTSVMAGIYYHQGFLDVTDDKNALKNNGEAEDSKATIRGLTIRIGVLF